MRIGMVGTRFAGLDGVTLESVKIARILEARGHELSWFAGERGPEFDPGVTVPEAHFTHPAELGRQSEYFGAVEHRTGLLDEVHGAAAHLTDALRTFVADFGIDVLVPQNALAIPMQFPLAIAITAVVAEGVPAVAHHHDFAWEKQRFTVSAVQQLVDGYFPPVLPELRHWVINSLARDELRRRRSVDAAIVPNVMDFGAGPPPEGDRLALRRATGLDPTATVILQPTRVVPRKSIETTIDLASAVGDGCAVVITHDEGDEGLAYGSALRAHADRLGVDLRFVKADGVDGAPSLADAYTAADLVAFPSRSEGFGNALLEAFFHRRPVFVRRYPVYMADIAPMGVECIEIDDFLSVEAIDKASRWLADPNAWVESVAVNFEVGRRHFSLEAIEDKVVGSVEAAAPSGR